MKFICKCSDGKVRGGIISFHSFSDLIAGDCRIFNFLFQQDYQFFGVFMDFSSLFFIGTASAVK